MTPVFAIVGRPNVGKSTLFNRLVRSQQALVLDEPGITRDRQIGQGQWQDRPFIVIDTGGIGEITLDTLGQAVLQQTLQAIEEAETLFFVVDGRQGLTAVDLQIAQEIRKKNKSVILVINKAEGLDTDIVKSDFYRLGFEQIAAVAATHNLGIENLLATAMENVPEMPAPPPPPGPTVALIGRPNVGKSTLMNRLLGEERMIVCDMPGTTRDSVTMSMERRGKPYTFIDTAGVRKKKNVTEVVEKFSIIKTLQAIKEAQMVLLVIDARSGLGEQDLSLIDFTIEAGRGIIICINKWDGLASEDREHVKDQIKYRLKFAEFAPVYFISALHGTGVGDLFNAIDNVLDSIQKELNTSYLTEILMSATEAHPPPLVKGRRIKLRYAHCGGHLPPTIIIHGNQTEDLPQSYQKYLSNYFIKTLKLTGTPVRIICKTGKNPYAGKRNVLTRRQIQKRRRLMKHVKK